MAHCECWHSRMRLQPVRALRVTGGSCHYIPSVGVMARSMVSCHLETLHLPCVVVVVAILPAAGIARCSLDHGQRATGKGSIQSLLCMLA
jgi:hypothetical protein